jgi:hypothetical protein
MKQMLHLEGVGQIPISVASDIPLRLTGRQGLALLRTLERHRKALEKQADTERDQEYGRGPGAYPGEIAKKIKRGDPRIGKQARSEANHSQRAVHGKIAAILRYSNGIEQFEITREIWAIGSDLPGKATSWVHADDVDILS